jgi:putative sporulation protein YyaC
MLLKTSFSQYVNINSSSAFLNLTESLYNLIHKNISGGSSSIVFVCIGTDRSTGDSLGPLIGYKINSLKYKNVYVYGNLDEPVHAKNLDSIIQQIYNKYTKPLVIAVDACLGKMDHVGYINIGEGPIKPGSGVNKDLAPIGDIYITGVVNFGGFMDFLVLQNTRLSVVMKMADVIAMSIKYVLWKVDNNPEIASRLCDI